MILLMLVVLLLLPTAQAQDVTISIGSETGVHADALIANADRCALEVGVNYEAHQLPPGEWINSILPTEAAVRSGLYDIAYIPISKIAQFVAADYLLPLEDFDIDALNPDDIAFFNLTEYEGKHWLRPGAGSNTTIKLRFSTVRTRVCTAISPMACALAGSTSCMKRCTLCTASTSPITTRLR
jgi:hypothetical protein